MTKKNKKPLLACRPLVRAACALYGKRYFTEKVKLIDDGTLSSVQPPYIVAANHAGFADVGGIAMLMRKKTCACYIASTTQFVGKGIFLKLAGVLPKKQFTVDTSLIRDIRYVLSKNRPVVIFPEAKLSVVGVPNIIKPATAKLVKFLKAPLITVCFHGSYLHKPRWAKSKRFLPLTAEVKLAATAEEIQTLTAEQIHEIIVKNLTYDDYAYQKAEGIEIDVPDLTEGLESILYKCPECGSEFGMTAEGSSLKCRLCGKGVVQNKRGELTGGKFSRVTDWYEWQRQSVRDETERDVYGYGCVCRAEALSPKNKFIDLGEAEFLHDGNGIKVTLESGEVLRFKSGMFYTLSFDAQYVYLPTSEKVYRLRFCKDTGVTAKINLAVEEQAKQSDNG